MSNVVVMRRARVARLPSAANEWSAGAHEAAAERYEGDEVARALGEAVSAVLLNDYGPERSRRHGRALIEAVRERLGI
jgi:hypothetical protein